MKKETRPKLTLKNIIGHLGRVNKHRWEMFKICARSGDIWMGLTHDLSKYSWAEFFTSARYYQGGKKSPVFAERAAIGYSSIEQHHHGHNPHHWEYWIYINRNHQPIKMPLRYVLEAARDHVAAGKAYMGKNWTFGNSIEHTRDAIERGAWEFHSKTKELLIAIEENLAKFGYDALSRRNVKLLAKKMKYDAAPNVLDPETVIRDDTGRIDTNGEPKRDIEKKRRIGILGGTFNPIHNGHMRMAELGMETGLDKVLFVPAGISPWKQSGVLPGAVRAEMVRLAIKDTPEYELSTMEIDREGTSYTIDTVRELVAQNPDAELTYIVGADAFLNIAKYKESEELLRTLKFVVVGREGVSVADVQAFADEIKEKYGTETTFINENQKDISSTEIREIGTQDLCPKNVAKFIESEGLYGHGVAVAAARLPSLKR
ncbi:hypothetical protein FACS189425_06090 [Clostridia bacterium]|nr:hypothetical protein FACS189425_06090 [Clostridia bacterium]